MTQTEIHQLHGEIARLIGLAQGHLLPEAWGHRGPENAELAKQRHDDLEMAATGVQSLVAELITMKQAEDGTIRVRRREVPLKPRTFTLTEEDEW